MDPAIITKLQELMALIGGDYHSYSFSVTKNGNMTNYSHSATDGQGNSVSVQETQVTPAP